jgi:hypothetical protein
MDMPSWIFDERKRSFVLHHSGVHHPGRWVSLAVANVVALAVCLWAVSQGEIAVATGTLGMCIADCGWLHERYRSGRVRFYIATSQQGVFKRIDEHRELFDLLEQDAPGFLEDHFWVPGWFEDLDDYLQGLADEAGVVPRPGRGPRSKRWDSRDSGFMARHKGFGLSTVPTGMAVPPPSANGSVSRGD